MYIRDMKIASLVFCLIFERKTILLTSLLCIGDPSLSQDLKPGIPDIRYSSDASIARQHNNVTSFDSGGNRFSLTLECHAFYPIYWNTEDADLNQFNVTFSNTRILQKSANISQYSFTTTVIVKIVPYLLRRLDEVKYNCKSIESPCMNNTVFISSHLRDHPHITFVTTVANSILLEQYKNCPWKSTIKSDTTPHLNLYPILSQDKETNKKNCQDILLMDVNGYTQYEEFTPVNDSITIRCRSHKSYLALGGRFGYRLWGRPTVTLLKNVTETDSGEYYEMVANLPISENQRPVQVFCSIPLWNSYISSCNATRYLKTQIEVEFTTTAESIETVSVEYSSAGTEPDILISNVTSNPTFNYSTTEDYTNIDVDDNVTYSQSTTYSNPIGGDTPFLSIVMIIIAAVSAFVICIFLIFIIYTVVKRIRESNRVKEYLPEQLAELKVLMTPKNSSFSDCHEIVKDSLTIDENSILGQGTFGVVYKAVLRTQSIAFDVAVKTCKNDSEFAINSLKKELKVISKMKRHINIVQLIGAVTENLEKGVSLYIVLEYCVNGNLRDYLRKNKNSFKNILLEDPVKIQEPNTFQKDYIISTTDLVSWSANIARGMQFLSSHNIVHGDLASRNVLLSDNRVAKLTDFGLAKQLEEYYYINKKEVPMPWKWMAYESLQYQKFSTKTDIWSYGITLWEIFSFGDSPWFGCQWGEEFLQSLIDGVRPKKPEYASDEIYKIMKQCWRIETVLRPHFNESAEQLEMILKKFTDKEKLEKFLSEEKDFGHEQSGEYDNYLIPTQPKKP